MQNYINETSRIKVVFIDAETEEELFDVPNRNWMNVGEVLTSAYGNDLIQKEFKKKFKNKKLPEKILAIAVCEFTLK